MNVFDFLDRAREFTPWGLVGSIVSVGFLRNATWPRRIALVLGGYAAAHTLSPQTAIWLGAEDTGGIGFMLGLFSMAIVAQVFAMIDAIEPRDLLDRLLRRVGLHGRDGGGQS